MARGAQGTAESTAQQGIASANQFNTQTEQQNQAIQSSLIPQYQNLINAPGYDQATKSAITLNSEGAAAASFGGSADAASRAAARTGNSASLIPGLDKIAQQKASTMAGVAAGNQVQFANRAKQDQAEGLQGMSSLYGVDQNMLAKSLGLPVEYLNQYNSAWKQPSFTQSLIGDAVSGGAQVGAAFAGKP